MTTKKKGIETDCRVSIKKWKISIFVEANKNTASYATKVLLF